MEISFGRPLWSGQAGRYFQDIFLEDEVVGCLVSTETSILNPIKEIYQVLATDTEENRQYPHTESEDVGFIFLQFNTEEAFITYLKKQRGKV